MTGRPVIYIARPMTSYGTWHGQRQVEAVRRHFPCAEVLDPETLFDSTAEWLAEWPTLLSGLDLLALVAAEDGTIGAGVMRELVDAIAAGVPIVALGPQGGLREIAGVTIDGGTQPDRTRMGRLMLGPPIRGPVLASRPRLTLVG